MIRVLSSTTPAQARGRRIHRASSGSAASTMPACRKPRNAQRLAGRVGVVHDRPVEPDHRHGVRPGPHQRDQSHEPHARQQQPPPGAGEPPVEPRVPELVHGRPHHQVVGEADPERVGRQADQVDQPAEQHPADHRPPAPAAPTARASPAPPRTRRRTPRGTRSAPAPPGMPCAASRSEPPPRRRSEVATSQVSSSGTTGTRRRRRRDRSHPAYGTSRVRADRQDRAFA